MTTRDIEFGLDTAAYVTVDESGQPLGGDVVIRNTGYWVAKDVTIARAETSRVRAFGRNWNFAGRSAAFLLGCLLATSAGCHVLLPRLPEHHRSRRSGDDRPARDEHDADELEDVVELHHVQSSSSGAIARSFFRTRRP